MKRVSISLHAAMYSGAASLHLPKFVVVVRLQYSLMLVGEGEGLNKLMHHAVSYR